ncbi:M64 family metallopeptidase [Streptomyces monticola]|uniref:M64 family metallopeptidase n=1 Tax=Streptomyces monticola TaxID=2666263 RepID=A0ABW2JEA5_9ACTN
MRRRISAVALAAGLAAVVAVTAPAAQAGPGGTDGTDRTDRAGRADTSALAQDQDPERVEYFSGPGAHPRHTTVPASAPLSAKQKATIADDGDVVPVVQAGPSDVKLDVVFIGDGYTAAQQGDFHTDVRAKWSEMAAVEPYASYEDLFNVWAVDAHSRQSGVSGDPTSDVRKDTALGSEFHCDGIERLLCVDTNKVEAYASKAADPDLVVVLGNSAKYGGAGYFDITSPSGYDGIATASSDHADSDQVAVHETGHSLGKLADEYWYDDGGTYTGPEPGDLNLTKLSAAEMSAQKAKWYRWLGQPSPDGGTVGAYEGGGYHPRGLNRPTSDSIMRTLGREFNLPGREAMIAGFHRHAPVLSSTTPTDRRLRRTERVRVETSGRAQLRWYVDGREVRRARGESAVTPRALGVPADGRPHTLTARATDPTDAVRDPKLRAELLTGSLSWHC